MTIKELEIEAASSEFWTDSKIAQNSMRNLSQLKKQVDDWNTLFCDVNDLAELTQLCIVEEDPSMSDSIREDLQQVRTKLARLELGLFLSGEYDNRNAILTLHAGAGGVDSQDWAEMLMRMYSRWSNSVGNTIEILESSPGDEAGIKSATLQINGDNAYGYLKAEKGVHRLVRLSPYDSDHARHTSFALVEVVPEVEEGVDIEVETDDLQIEVFKAGGAGGQSVQKNSTAVRITHIPTGIKVSCQNERSQHQNKVIAMRILASRLADLQRIEREKHISAIKGKHVSAEWGNQIRSYVLHPYKLVKDHRTGEETANADGVLDGDIDQFIRAYLTSTVR
ncbi:MAG: peptide chain release factor 2 [Dehalococcoidia bacterium]|nr:peptide chain release factor 2 [Dehalococcoidia bacterium]